MLVGNRHLQRAERRALKTDRGDRAGGDDLAAAAVAQIVQQGAGGDRIDHDRGVLRRAAGHRPQVHGAVEAMFIQREQILVLLEVAAHHRHPQLRAPARQPHHRMPLRQFTYQRASNKPARPGNQYLHVDDSTLWAQDCNLQSMNQRTTSETWCRVSRSRCVDQSNVWGWGAGPRLVWSTLKRKRSPDAAHRPHGSSLSV